MLFRGKIGQKVKINTSKNAEEASKNFDILCKELENLEAELVEVRQNFAQIQKHHRDRQIELARATAFEKNLKTDTYVNLMLFLFSIFD